MSKLLVIVKDLKLTAVHSLAIIEESLIEHGLRSRVALGRQS